MTVKRDAGEDCRAYFPHGKAVIRKSLIHLVNAALLALKRGRRAPHDQSGILPPGWTAVTH